jgi:uncharacterized membrane protein YidH (DUF202 family)
MKPMESYETIEFRESIRIPESLLRSLNLEQLASELWAPLSTDGDTATVVAALPGSAVEEQARRTLGVKHIEFRVALPQDIVRIIEHNRDLNPGFPPAGGRTPLAVVRTLLAEVRLRYSQDRIVLGKGRTGLAFLRTGISFITVALVLFRVFGLGWMLPVEILLIAAGAIMAADGFAWYLPVRRHRGEPSDFRCTAPTGGTTVLQAPTAETGHHFSRSDPVAGAAALRADWGNLSPIMRRRFLASDRTDLAEERTALACLRTGMARARTGLAFTRSGVALIGVGVALLLQFPTGPWTVLDWTLIVLGVGAALEGFHWYLPGRAAGSAGERSVRNAKHAVGVWDLFFPPVHAAPAPAPGEIPTYLRRPSWPGIWGTTGLALERTVLADRRNVMARLRTVMARSRTGLALVRTGMSIAGVGFGLLVYFGAISTVWTVFNLVLAAVGLALIADGLYWHLPAERIRREFPYCFGEMEIVLPDYGRPAAKWQKVSFSDGDA